MMKNNESLVDLFQKVAKSSKKNRIVLRDKERKWTLEELDIITDRLAKHFIKEYKCRKGSCVAIYMNKCAEYVFSYIAALKAGAAYLPLDITYPETLLFSVLEEAQPVVVCTFTEFLGKLSETTPSFNFGQVDWEDSLSNDVGLPNDITGDDLAYIVYSSGTTGKPKGIACPHRGAVVSYKYRFEKYPYLDDDVVASNVFFVWEMFRPILQGTTLTIIPDDVIYDPMLLCQFLKSNNVTRMLFTPSLLETVFDTQTEEIIKESFRKMRIIWLCGEVVTCALLKRVMSLLQHVSIENLYSISECHDVSYENLNEFFARKEERKFAPVGKIIPSVKVLILDNAHKKVPIGVQGEIYVAGPTLANGYIHRPELNKKRFLEVPEEYQSEDGTRMYRTGDFGYMLPNSTLEVCGRCDTLVKIRGYSVEVQAIETNLLKLPWVSSCAVVSIGEEGQDKYLAAYMVLKENVTRKVLRAELKKHLPFYMVPSYFVFVDRMPVLPASSKIDKKALPPVNRESDIAETEALPQTPTEHRLAKIWSDVLGHPTIDIQESFFDLGGHSLTAARLLSKVNMEFGRNLSICDLFTAPTIYGMAKILDGNETNSIDSKIDLEAQVESHDVKDNISDLHLRSFWRSTEWHNRFNKAHVLLTGTTGFLGVHILASLLQNSQTRIMCLIRESTTETVDMRLENALKNRGLLSRAMKEQFKDRVKAVAADVALTNFGLSEEYYHFLTYDIDVVIHAAAYVNLIYPYQALHGVNVLGTRNILDFCHANKIKPLHYISTDGVISAGIKDVDEGYSIENCRNGLHDGYGQSKYVAEQLVHRALSRGLPSIIYRLGNQAADTLLGKWNEQDFTYLLLRAVIMTGQAPKVDWTIELTPVDFSSKFITEIATNLFVGNVGKTFHLINIRGPKWSELLNWLRKFGYRIEEVEFNVWKQRILNSADKNLNALQKLIEVMMNNETFFSTMSTYKRTNTDHILNEISWKYPNVDEILTKFWLNQLIEQGIIPSPKGHMLRGKVCIVTGASEGIGEAIAKTLAIDGGAIVVLASRQLQKLQGITEYLCESGCSKSDVLALKCDVTDRNNVEDVVKTVLSHYGKIDVLVNCAGLMYYTLMKNLKVEEWSKQIDVNCHGTTNITGAVLPTMIEQKRGHILNITSDAGKRGFAGLAVYSGTKFYIEGFMQALRQEVLEYGIKITNIQPGDVSTKLASRSTDEEARSKYDFSNAGHSILDPDDVAKTVLHALAQPHHVAINEVLIEPQAAPI